MNKHALLSVSISFLTVSMLSACGESPQADVADLGGLKPGWNVIEAGGDTVCSDGSPYNFYVRPGSTEKLMVYFQGGGACWTGATCDPDLKPSYYINLEKADPRRYGGIFQFENPDNPVKDHSVVYAPYCTGDVHIGDAVESYEAPQVEAHAAHPVTVQHKGYVNTDAVLNWTYTHFPKPTEIFVAGSSAGSIPSPYFAMRIADQYPDARISQLGDASGGYRVDEGTTVYPHESWNTLKRLRQLPEFEDMDMASFNYESLYIAASNHHPEITFAQFDTAEDATQKFFLSLGGQEQETLLPQLQQNQADIRKEVSNFYSYIAGGDMHTILVRPEFYAYHVNGVLVYDWVTKLVNGEPLTDVYCGDCSVAEVTEGFVAPE